MTNEPNELPKVWGLPAFSGPQCPKARLSGAETQHYFRLITKGNHKYTDVRRHLTPAVCAENKLIIALSKPLKSIQLGMSPSLFGKVFCFFGQAEKGGAFYGALPATKIEFDQTVIIRTQLGRAVHADRMMYFGEAREALDKLQSAYNSFVFPEFSALKYTHKPMGAVPIGELAKLFFVQHALKDYVPLPHFTCQDHLQFGYSESFWRACVDFLDVLSDLKQLHLKSEPVLSEVQAALEKVKPLWEIETNEAAIALLAAMEPQWFCELQKLCYQIIFAIAVQGTTSEHAIEAINYYVVLRKIAAFVRLHPEKTRHGLDRIWLRMDKWEIITTEMKPEAFSAEPTEAKRLASEQWEGVGSELFLQSDSQTIIQGSYPLVPKGESEESERRIHTRIASTLSDELTEDRLLEQWNEARTDFLNECVALKQWTIPWGATVQVNYDMFPTVEVFETAGAITFLWWTKDGRCTWSILIPHVREFVHSNVSGWSLSTANTELLMAALVRDFWVAEERRKIFAVSVQRSHKLGKKIGAQKIIYLPRIRYDTVHQAAPLEELLSATRARHYVRNFFRKANPTNLQSEYARLNNITVPEGHTFVRGHYRGGGSENQAIYRSRSALQAIYHVSAIDLGESEAQIDDWFAFELSIRTLLERLAYTIVNTAVRGKGDDGIDIVAVRKSGEIVEEWLVQAKCYSSHRTVGANVVREMLGSTTDYGGRHKTQPRSMIVTTSTFSADAQRLALAHGVKLIDGDNLRSIASSENSRSV